MPFIDIKTNVSVSDEKKEAIKSSLGQVIGTLPGKSESWLMVGIEPEYSLWFQGEDLPAAMVSVSVWGGASASEYEKLTGEICTILETEINVPRARTYVKYIETENWGWKGSNF